MSTHLLAKNAAMRFGLACRGLICDKKEHTEKAREKEALDEQAHWFS